MPTTAQLNQRRQQLQSLSTPSDYSALNIIQSRRAALKTFTKPAPVQPVSTAPIKVSQPQSPLQQAEQTISSNVIKLSKEPIVGKTIQVAKNIGSQVVNTTKQYIKSAKENPISFAKGAVEQFGTDIAVNVSKVTGAIEKQLYNHPIIGINSIELPGGAKTPSVGINPPKLPERYDITKQAQAYSRLVDETIKRTPISEQRGAQVGKVLSDLYTFAVASEISTATVGSTIVAPAVTKFLPKAIKLIPKINDAIGFLGVGQLQFDKSVDKTRVDKLKSDLVSLALFEGVSTLTKGLTKGTKGIISKVVNSASNDIKSTKGADINILENAVNEAKTAIQQDTGKTAETILTKNIASSPDNFGFKEEISTPVKPTVEPPRLPTKTSEITSEKLIQTETTKKPFNTKGAQAVQKVFNEQLTKLSQTVSDEKTLVSQSEKLINSTIEQVKGDRNGLAGVRTSIVKQMNDLAGVTPGAPFKQQYAELQVMMKEGSGVDKVLSMLEDKKNQLDEMIKSTPEISKVITQKTEKIVTQKPLQIPIGTGQLKESKLGVRLDTEAVKKELTDTLGQLPGYKELNLAKQGERAVKLTQEDTQRAMDIAMGRKAPPSSIHPEAVWVAVKNKAIAERDLNLIKELANSPIVSEATALGQRIVSLRGAFNDGDPVKGIQNVMKAREKQFTSNFKNQKVSDVVNKGVNNIKSKVKLPDKYDWGKFLDSIQC